MPKQKKQPRNAYYFFMVDKKREWESQGTRFPGGIRDIAAMHDVREEWKVLEPSRKASYEELAKAAKDADRMDLTNKFTNSGESFAEVQERERQQEAEMGFKNKLLEAVTRNTEVLDVRNFVILKTIHSCEANYPNTDFWPVEIAIGAFNLQKGLISTWWSLVNTFSVPTGYASAAKDTHERTLLPYPGSIKFKVEHGNFYKMIQTLKKFIMHHVEPFNGYYAIFVMQNDQICAEGCLQWLHRNATYESDEQADDMKYFLDHVKFLKVSQLLLKLAGVAKGRDTSYNATIAQYGHLEDAAVRVLGNGAYDYRDCITCSFHNQEEESVKMHICCRNVVLRSIFIILQELMDPMGIEPTPAHYVDSVKSPPAYGYPMPRPVESEPEKPAPLPDSFNEAWGSRPASRVAEMDPRRHRSPEPRESERFPPLGRSAAPSNGSYGNKDMRSTWGEPSRRNKPASLNNEEEFPELIGGNQGSSGAWADAWSSARTAPTAAGRGTGGIREPQSDFIPFSGGHGFRGRGRGSSGNSGGSYRY